MLCILCITPSNTIKIYLPHEFVNMTHGDGVEGSFSENYEIILTMIPQLRPHGSKKGLLKNGQWHIISIDRIGQQAQINLHRKRIKSMAKTNEKYAIEIKKLTKTYGKSRGISELELSVKEGDFFGFIGPNGAGKSTTIRTLLGLISPTSGRASVLGYDIVSEKKKILQEAGYLPSEINFYNGMKVKDVIKYSADIRRKDCTEKASVLSQRLGLDLNKKVEELSLGNRKKVGIVCAIQHSPRLLILDEPTSGLDPLMQREFFSILKEENDAGSTIFFSSHILSEVQNHCKTAAFIKDGRIIISDKVETLEQTGTKKITLTGPSDYSHILSLAGITPAGSENCFFYTGDFKALLRVLSEETIKDLTITEPSLEEIFMNYYEAKNGGKE